MRVCVCVCVCVCLSRASLVSFWLIFIYFFLFHCVLFSLSLSLFSRSGCGTNGFTATQGWDPVTGLGTPNFQKLSAIVSSLQ